MYLQILTNPSHHFIDSSLYKDVILVAWDPAPYSANLNLVSAETKAGHLPSTIANRFLTRSTSQKHLDSIFQMYLSEPHF